MAANHTRSRTHSWIAPSPTVAAVSDVCPELEATYQCCTAICTHEFELHTKHEIAVIDLCELVLGIDGPSDDVIHCEGSGQYEQCKE